MAIEIGRSYIRRKDGMSRLCARIRKANKETVLWFAVRNEQEQCLSLNRADPFVIALLPTAMRENETLVCSDPMSERLHYQLRSDLIPALVQAGDLYHKIAIDAPLTTEKFPDARAVATGFSGGVDSLYTVLLHGKDCEYPLTHLAVFNSGVYEGAEYRTNFWRVCGKCDLFAEEQGLNTVFVDSNIAEVLPERYIDVVTYRLAAFALSIQGLVSTYMLSSGRPIEDFAVDVHSAAKSDPLTINCVCTESLQFYLSGISALRTKKLERLTEWEPAHRWLAPCIFGEPGGKNCGHCKKCVRDLAALYALGKLDSFAPVFDVADYRRHLPQRLGVVLANRNGSYFRDAAALLREREAYIPPLAEKCAEVFSGAMDKIREGN